MAAAWRPRSGASRLEYLNALALEPRVDLVDFIERGVRPFAGANTPANVTPFFNSQLASADAPSAAAAKPETLMEQLLTVLARKHRVRRR